MASSSSTAAASRARSQMVNCTAPRGFTGRMRSHAVTRSLNLFCRNLCDLDRRSGCLPEQCVLLSLLAPTIWAGMLSGLLVCHGALSAGLMPVIESTPPEARSADCAHKEQHYRVVDLVDLWALNRETVRLMVKDDQGVVKIRFGLKKCHTTYRIPESAAKRIHFKFGGLESSFREQHFRIGDLNSTS